MSTSQAQGTAADGLSEIAQAMGIQPRMTRSREALSTLVRNLTDHNLFVTYFIPFLDGYNHYNWADHSEDPTEVLRAVHALWVRLGRHPNMTQLGFNRLNIQSFSELLVWFRRAIATEMLKIFPRYGNDLLWHPTSRVHGDAFGYVLFLWMYLQTGSAPDEVSRIYSGALHYLGSVFRCKDCGSDFESIDHPVCKVCPTLKDGEAVEYPWD